jgi:hypothetical protein
VSTLQSAVSVSAASSGCTDCSSAMHEGLLSLCCSFLVVAILLSFEALLSICITDDMVVRHLEGRKWQGWELCQDEAAGFLLNL